VVKKVLVEREQKVFKKRGIELNKTNYIFFVDNVWRVIDYLKNGEVGKIEKNRKD
jgi:hypothetical protein